MWERYFITDNYSTPNHLEENPMLRSRRVRIIAVLGMTLPLIASAAGLSGERQQASAGKSIERGRYLVRIAGCNDCHTPGYAESSGAIPEKQWLTGSPVGWRGPWGTTYPANIRLSMSRIDEARWVEIGHTTQFRPPMPWFALRDMRTEDLRAIYRFVRYLGPAGSPAPDFVPPGKAPSGPYIQFPGEAN
jgi:mono/diheme cytochrome c family protein